MLIPCGIQTYLFFTFLCMQHLNNYNPLHLAFLDYLKSMTNPLTHNAAHSRYEMIESGHTVYADYSRAGDVLTIKYVFAPPELRGTGAAGRFMDALMQMVRAENLTVIPLCGYAASWIARHPDYQDTLAP